ncbi:hypothetical protein ABM90_10460 [Rhodococcus erythropolis]|nr:hypothetical protein ABM90_10460 [Rhodococcus erythropolis]
MNLGFAWDIRFANDEGGCCPADASERRNNARLIHYEKREIPKIAGYLDYLAKSSVASYWLRRWGLG